MQSALVREHGRSPQTKGSGGGTKGHETANPILGDWLFKPRAGHRQPLAKAALRQGYSSLPSDAKAMNAVGPRPANPPNTHPA